MLKSEALGVLAEKISRCTLCQELSQFRLDNQYLTVPGTGNPNARVLVLGEAPGDNEAKQGLPFVGKSGKLLTNILLAAGLARDAIFITNTIKCRPPGNRDPEPAEVSNCRKFLEMQIRCIDPEWILCFGKVASVNLLGLDSKTPIGSLRGKIHEFQGKKVIATYHPSYLLRNPAAKEDVWQDLQPVIAALQS